MNVCGWGERTRDEQIAYWNGTLAAVEFIERVGGMDALEALKHIATVNLNTVQEQSDS